jgi:hypothetical protein
MAVIIDPADPVVPEPVERGPEDVPVVHEVQVLVFQVVGMRLFTSVSIAWRAMFNPASAA